MEALDGMHHSSHKRTLAQRIEPFFYMTLLLEIVFIILFSLFTTYGTDNVPGTDNQTDVNRYWPFYTDVTVMVFIGFGFLMTVFTDIAFR